jgi:hypothetical protein
MSTTANDVPLDAWISVTSLIAAEHIESRRAVYHQIDRGMPHARMGRVIRVRRCDWRAWHERHLIGGDAA